MSFFFYHEWMLNVIKYCYASVEIIMWFLSFLLFSWCMTLIFCMLNYTCNPGMAPEFLGVWSFSCVFVWFLLQFSPGFLHWCSSVMLACNFLFCVAFLFPFGSWWWWPRRMSWECSSLHIFLEQFDQHRYYHISPIWEHSSVKSWAFLCWRLLIPVSSACDWSVHS